MRFEMKVILWQISSLIDIICVEIAEIIRKFIACGVCMLEIVLVSFKCGLQIFVTE